MVYIKAFIIKFLIVGTLTFSLFGIFYNATTMRLLSMTLVVSAVTFIGDVFILPRINQAWAAVADFAGYFLLYWLLGMVVVEDGIPLMLPALTAAYFGVMAEMIYHIYIMDQLHEPTRGAPIPVRYETEFAEEEVDSEKKD